MSTANVKANSMGTPEDPPKVSNFLRQIIESDLAHGTYAQRKWAGTPGDAAHHASGNPDPAKIRTRFPPEPNGYLHVGHAKSICLNFGLARDYGGVCHMRFDDTNPEKEDTEYVNSILDAVKWLGFNWDAHGTSHLYQASDYFDFMYRAAEFLIQAGLAYVDEQSAEEMRIHRGDFNTPGKDSPFRARTTAENLSRFREMRDGKLADGAAVLRAKIDMASPNINMRDPAIYRIRRAPITTRVMHGASTPCTPLRIPLKMPSSKLRTAFVHLNLKTSVPFTIGSWPACANRTRSQTVLCSPHCWHSQALSSMNLHA